MSITRRHLLGAAAIAACGAGCAQAPQTLAPMYTPDDLQHAERLRELGLADREAWTLLQQLVTQVGPRPAGSAADAKAAAWASAAMRRLALQNVRVDDIPMRMWRRGAASARLLVPGAPPGGEALTMVALGNSVATPAGGIDAPIAWYKDFAALQADRSDAARGRIVFIDQHTERTKDGSGYGPAVIARSNGAIEAARRGALAVGIRSIGTDSERVAHTGAMRYDAAILHIPAFAVSAPDAERIAALQAGGQALRLQLQLDASSNIDAVTHNVIGEVAGTDLAHEIVLIGAHLDSWDIAPGAADDGAGVAIVTAAAALLQRAGARNRPRRTVRVVLFGNEENGFDGAQHYAERHKAQPHQLVAESDFGAGRIYQLKSRVQPAALPLVDAMARVLAPLGVAQPAQGQARNDGAPGPDAGVLMRRMKWPALQLSQDGTSYFDVHHTVNDTLDRIDPATLPQNVACWAVMAWLAAQSPVPFGPPAL